MLFISDIKIGMAFQLWMPLQSQIIREKILLKIYEIVLNLS